MYPFFRVNGGRRPGVSRCRNRPPTGGRPSSLTPSEPARSRPCEGLCIDRRLTGRRAGSVNSGQIFCSEPARDSEERCSFRLTEPPAADRRPAAHSAAASPNRPGHGSPLYNVTFSVTDNCVLSRNVIQTRQTLLVLRVAFCDPTALLRGRAKAPPHLHVRVRPHIRPVAHTSGSFAHIHRDSASLRYCATV